nr:MAG TPA: hypothetical protein [Caudoviricetes sp.]
MSKTKKFGETKALQAFNGSIRTLNQHLQLVDRSLTIANKYVNINKKDTLAQALACTIETHPQLNIPCNGIDIARTYATSRKKLNEQAIIELYRIFANYIKNLIEEFIHTDPYPLLNSVCENKDNKIEFRKIIDIGNYDLLIEHMSNIIFRRFENEQSTPKLLDKILSYAKIKIESSALADALLFLEIRHLIIHNNSKADDEFLVKAKNKITIPASKKIPINYKLTEKAIAQISFLCQLIDKELVGKNMVRERCIIYN